MKKKYFTFILFLLSTVSFSNTAIIEFDYSIVFVGCFTNDIVSLSINKTLLVNQYKVANIDSIKKGHLSLTQSDKEINIFYNGQQITKSKIDVDFVIDVIITVNRELKKFRIDLRKGKVLLIDYCMNNNECPEIKTLIIEQITEPVILM
jgi:hypothetical protein